MAALALGGAIEGWLLAIPHGRIVEVVVVAAILAQAPPRSAWSRWRLARSARAVRRPAARRSTSASSCRDPDSSSAEAWHRQRGDPDRWPGDFAGGVVAPATCGTWWRSLPGLFLYKTATALDGRDLATARRDPSAVRLGGGRPGRSLAGLVPARLAAAMLPLLAAAWHRLPSSERARGLRPAHDCRCTKKHRSPNAGWPRRAAAAERTGIGAGRPAPRWHGSVVPDEWLGAGRARATSRGYGQGAEALSRRVPGAGDVCAGGADGDAVGMIPTARSSGRAAGPQPPAQHDRRARPFPG